MWYKYRLLISALLIASLLACEDNVAPGPTPGPFVTVTIATDHPLPTRVQLSPPDKEGRDWDFTPFTVTYRVGTRIEASVEAIHGSFTFSHWTVNGTPSNDTTVTCIVRGEDLLQAHYLSDPATVKIRSNNPKSGVKVQVWVLELLENYEVSTPADLVVPAGTTVNVTVLDVSQPDGTFVRWDASNGADATTTLWRGTATDGLRLEAMFPVLYTFTPERIGPLCPPFRRGGDREFAGHGPSVSLETSMVLIGGQIGATVYFHLVETQSDWTEGWDTWPYIKLTNFSQARRAIGFRSDSYSQAIYTDTDITYDNVYPSSGPVASYKVMGDTEDDDLGCNLSTHSHVYVYFKPFTVRRLP